MNTRLSPFRNVLALLLLSVFGALLLPWQARLQRLERSANFRTVPIDLTLREQIGQSGFLAALSGFRSPVAAFLWIQAQSAWERTEWGRMAALFDTVTTLEPHMILYWDIAAWHMAWNASAAALQDRRQASEALRERASRQYITLGREILERGIRNNPGNYRLYDSLGRLARDREGDHAAAADAFAKAASIPGSPAYMSRFAGYEASLVPGRQREAYERLLALYKLGELQRLPTLLSTLQSLEVTLGIPAGERIRPPSAPPAPAGSGS